MIFGIGTDLVEITRIEQSLERTPNIVDKILSRAEKEIYASLSQKQKANYVAKRFAAKEAFAKATGKGVRDEIQMRFISVINDDLGKPCFEFSEEIKTWCSENKITQAELSLSDTALHALAFVVLSTY